MFLALLFFVVVRFLPLWCDCSDPLVSFVHETVLGSDRGWVDWEQVLETRLSLFTLWCNVWLRFSFSKNKN